MSRHKPRGQSPRLSSLTAQLGPDDGTDPRKLHRSSRHPNSGRSRARTMALCRQVEIAVSLALQAEVQDPQVQELEIIEVSPAPDSRRLRILAFARQAGDECQEVERKLALLVPFLRQRVAEAICRKRTPELLVQVLTKSEGEG